MKNEASFLRNVAARRSARTDASSDARPSLRNRWDRKRVLITLVAIIIVLTFIVSALSPLLAR